MTKRDFERILAFHGGPAMAGIKAGNLISCAKDKYPDFFRWIRQYQYDFKDKGIRFEVLYTGDKNHLLFTYRERVLKGALEQGEVQALLERLGYPVCSGVDEILSYLKMRFHAHKDFPHEIGVFLGYPLADILGYVKYHGRGCKLSGYWKVYGDVEEAKKRFLQFEKCRNAITKKVQAGWALSQIFPSERMAARAC